MKTVFAILIAIVFTALPALLHGHFANRWGTPPNLRIAGKQLHHFPRQVGPWKSVEDERPLSEEVCRELGLVEHFHRKYTHSETGNRFEVLLMVGPPGRLVRHPPDVCYTNRANRQVGEAVPLEISSTSNPHQFRLLHFKRTQLPIHKEFWVAYAYAADRGNWSTPASPRMTFGGGAVLYKLQVLSDMPEEDSLEDLSEFLEQWVKAFPTVLVEDLHSSASEIPSERRADQ